MKFLIALDQWVVDQVFQRIVNLTQRKVGWHCEQCALFATLTAIYRPFEDHDQGWMIWISVFFNLALGFILWVQARFAPYRLGDEWPGWRRFWLFIVVFDCFTKIDSPARIFMEVAVTAYFYFSACDDPPPRKRKEEKKAVTQPPLFGTMSPTPNQG